MGFMRTNEATNAAAFSKDEERWAAVLRRDRSADGVFYYSVRTTGVYCRPNAPGLAEQHAASVAKACRLIETSGEMPKAYAAVRRAQRVRNELPKRGAVTEAIYDAG